MSEFTAMQSIFSLIGDAVITVDVDTTVTEIAKVMNDSDIGAVGVGSTDEILGIVSERDLVRVLTEDGDPGLVTAGDLASRKLVWCQEDSVVGEVAQLMFEQYVRHVLVADDKGGLAGIVSARDLLAAYASGDELVD